MKVGQISSGNRSRNPIQLNHQDQGGYLSSEGDEPQPRSRPKFFIDTLNALTIARD